MLRKRKIKKSSIDVSDNGQAGEFL